MRILIAVMLALVVFAVLIFTALWARTQELKNSLGRKEQLAQKRFGLLRQLGAKSLPEADGGGPEAIEAWDHALTAAAAELRINLETDPAQALALAQLIALEAEANSARVNYAGAVKNYNRAVECAPTSFVARKMGLKKVPRPHLT